MAVVSCDSIFPIQRLFPQSAVDWYPFLESIFPSLLEMKPGSPELRFTRIEPDKEELPGIYDFTFMAVETDGQEQILWSIYDYTWLYEQFRELQQRRNELEIQRHQMERDYRKLVHQKDLLLRKNTLLERNQKIQIRYYNRLRQALQSPINALDGLTGLARMAMSTGAFASSFLQQLRVSVDQLQSITEELEMVAQAGALSIAPEEEVPFALQEVLEQVNGLLREQLKEEHILSYTLEEDVPPQLIGRPVYLLQILYSLLVHALQYQLKAKMWVDVSLAESTSENCTICLTFRQRSEEVAWRQEEDQNREGYPAVFQLAVARQLVELQKGQIRLEENTNDGAPSIVCLLPFLRPHSA